MTEEANEEEKRREWRRDWVKSCREGSRERDGREYENLEKVSESKMEWMSEWVDKMNESELHENEWDDWMRLHENERVNDSINNTSLTS